MNTKEIYVGTRKKSHELTDIIGREIYHLNEGLSKKLRSSVLKHGIKKTEQRKRLEFLIITKDELKKFKNEIIPLVTIDSEEMIKSLNDVNSRYSGRMDWETGQKYKQELESSLESCVTVIGKDTNFRNKPDVFKGDNPYKVGDWIKIYNGYGYRYQGYVDQVRIWKVTEKSYWIEEPFLLDGNSERIEILSNQDYSTSHYNNVQIINDSNGWDQQTWDWVVPYKGNEESFVFKQYKTPFRVTKDDIEFNMVIGGSTYDDIQRGYQSSHDY